MSVMSRERFLKESALLVSGRGTCSRMQVGCVAALRGRIIASGYNGAPSGLNHCRHILLEHEDTTYPGCKIAVHAEANLISFAAREGISLKGSDLYCTLSPCTPCAQLIINCGFKSVYYIKPYRDIAGLVLLESADIPCIHLGGE